MSATWREAIAPEKDVIAPSCRRPGEGRTPISAARLDLRLLQPKRHVHVVIHRGRGAEMVARLVAFARAPVELAEAEMAVGDERAHAARFGKTQRAEIVSFTCVGVEAIGVGGDVAEEVQYMGRSPGLER